MKSEVFSDLIISVVYVRVREKSGSFLFKAIRMSPAALVAEGTHDEENDRNQRP